ncbi:hypothetical protein VRU48_00190 [Pedobacter sp. KR3-3]|uniref:Uncharacterized protein n=1 Tax=Pedobacter albus TaxID=3113905 RepID=A0ABU7I221_9SPHI|nr:hypothetical protein [Pedobacter sp. KR3-3]MEE1943503.1 hypothetical protein [Pedobacter sp. KR3-3]
MEYYTYWSISEAPSYAVKSNMIWFVIAVIGGICWLLIKKLMKNDANKSLSLLGAGTFFILGVVMYCLSTFVYADSSEAALAKELQAADVVEGVVADFQRSYRSAKGGAGETIESFSVDSVQLAYGDALLGKFNSFSQTHNDVIYNGQKVRVTYRGRSSYGEQFNSILKIEIAK